MLGAERRRRQAFRRLRLADVLAAFGAERCQQHGAFVTCAIHVSGVAPRDAERRRAGRKAHRDLAGQRHRLDRLLARLHVVDAVHAELPPLVERDVEVTLAGAQDPRPTVGQTTRTPREATPRGVRGPRAPGRPASLGLWPCIGACVGHARRRGITQAEHLEHGQYWVCPSWRPSMFALDLGRAASVAADRARRDGEATKNAKPRLLRVGGVLDPWSRVRPLSLGGLATGGAGAARVAAGRGAGRDLHRHVDVGGQVGSRTRAAPLEGTPPTHAVMLTGRSWPPCAPPPAEAMLLDAALNASDDRP